MKRYLAKLHKKSDQHKKRFALLFSATVTLLIFGVWSLAVFPPEADPSLASGTNDDSNVAEVSPFQSLGTNLAASVNAIRNSFGELKTGFKRIDIETEYRDLRDGALDTYGQ